MSAPQKVPETAGKINTVKRRLGNVLGDVFRGAPDPENVPDTFPERFVQRFYFSGSFRHLLGPLT
jgi:hypothetical protein